ncbi:MAG: hypothetical protein LBE31_07785 [Deltaproteobacteria bacterium]|jgi:hypothetical protein|nr:hypothetical protein [Deltaproteobacteria bacterium]
MTLPSLTGRLIIFPAISPENLNLSEPAFYLTWRAWEDFRIRVLGQSPPKSLSPLEIEEPIGFAKALATLIESAKDLGPAVFQPPLASLESEGQLLKELRQNINSPKPSSISPNRSSITAPHLALALWAASENYRLEADRILITAALDKSQLISKLMGQYELESELEAYLEDQQEGEQDEKLGEKLECEREGKRGGGLKELSQNNNDNQDNKVSQDSLASLVSQDNLESLDSLDNLDDQETIFQTLSSLLKLPPPQPSFPTGQKALLRAWLSLAGPVLKVGDRLMAAPDSFSDSLEDKLPETTPGSKIFIITESFLASLLVTGDNSSSLAMRKSK